MFSRAIWKNIHSWVFQRLQIALVLRTCAISIIFEKLTRACFCPNCTRNHTITYTRNTCMQQPLALIGIQGTIFSKHEVFWVYDFEIVFIFTLSIFFKKCENNESIISFNYKIHNLHNFLVSNTINILIYCQIWYKIGSITPNTKMFWNVYIKLTFLPIKFQDIHYFHECSFAFIFISNLLIF